MTTSRHRIARIADLPGDGPHPASVGGRDLVLLRTDGQLRAFDGLCPHQGALLGEGELEGGVLVCRNHRWRFDPRTGARIGGPQCLRSYPVHEHEGHVEIELPDTAGEPAPTTKASSQRVFAELPGPRPLPLVGNALQLDTRRVHVTFEAWAREHGPFYRVVLGRRAFAVVSDPTLIAEILRKRPESYRRMSRMADIFDEMGVDGVFSAEGTSWRPQRKLAMGALDHRHLTAFFSTLHDVAERLRRRWETAADAGDVLDVQEEMMRFTVDVTTRLAFSEPTDVIGGASSQLLDDLDPLFPTIARRINAMFPYWRYLQLPRDRHFTRSLGRVRKWLEDVIARTRERLQADPSRAEHPSDFVEAMLVARDPEGRPFSDRLLFGNALTMLVAGEDTTANTMAWAVHFLLDAPEELSALRTRIDAVLGSARVPADMATTRALDEIEAVANETMRLEPVAPMMFLETIPEVTLGDVRLPAATPILVLTRPSALDPARIDDPHAFRPERWRDGHTAAALQRAGVFVPFGSGPRICPGRSLALLEIRMVLATLLRNFELERVGRSQDVGEELGFTLSPTNLRARLRRRSDAPAPA
ncbi:cytochrome P450 [Paraliomyxa miuraensis]|uniref:cytochrome P450 n=1 Tax=Paraliomyxa miuraensis TaxID=376150 RepID=UPI0022567712|nr:cytochrome P450 [Paraliomyxa miuraensis]MCX4240751.1 cytochrome P450 [Paraliomyxa miuraensis]